MSLEPTLTDITAKLRQGKFPNEQSIGRARPPGAPLRKEQISFTTEAQRSQKTPPPSAFSPLASRHHPPTKPAEFIEVKPPGKAEDGVRQALE